MELACRRLGECKRGRGWPRPREPNSQTFKHALRFRFKATNNEAEYEALLSGLKFALELQVKGIEVFTDSQLLVGHINEDYVAWDATMKKYLSEAKKLVSRFQCFIITRVSQAQNEQADTLARLASGQDTEPPPEVK